MIFTLHPLFSTGWAALLNARQETAGAAKSPMRPRGPGGGKPQPGATTRESEGRRLAGAAKLN